MKYIFSIIFLVYSTYSFSDETFEGCYTHEEEIANLATGKSSKTTSWVQIIKNENNTYKMSGEIYGANFHVCSLEPEEGVELILRKKDNTLNFKFVDKSYDMNCDLKIIKNKNHINIQDKNFNCSRFFACGTRVSVHDVTLAYRSRNCTSN